MLYRPKFIISFAIFVFLFSAGFVLAAWRDAPAGPPSYGAVSPDTQDDYKPMNLGSATQDKSGVIGATGFRDSDDANYFLDLNSGIMAGVIAGSVGIGQTVPSAKLTINNPSTDGKIGSSGDAIYAYANSSNAAISTEQTNSSGYAIYASGGINYFSGNVGIGTTGPSFSIGRGLHISGVAGTPDAVIELSETTSGLGNFELRSVARGTSGNRLEIGEGSDTFITIRSDDDGGGVTSRGNVGIGTTDPGAYRLNVNGDANATKLCIAGDCKSSWPTTTSLSWADITSKPAGFNDDVDDVGITSETDPSVYEFAQSAPPTCAGDDKLTSNGTSLSCATDQTGSGADGLGTGNTGTTNKIPRWSSINGLSDSVMTQNAAGNDISVSGTITADAFVDREDTGYYINPRGDSSLYGNLTLAAGSGTAANGWFVSSDARLKKNVETLSGALDKIGRTRGVSYDLASGLSARQIGVIAQELEQEFPELVVTDGNGYKAVAYDRLSAVLIEAVKELKSQNQALQSRLDLLDKKW